MTKPIVRIYTEVGKFIDREMNDKEFAQYEADRIAEESSLALESQKAAEKAALLAKLGITEDEAKLLLS
jgi:hypothetical protein